MLKFGLFYRDNGCKYVDANPGLTMEKESIYKQYLNKPKSVARLKTFVY